MEDWSLETWVRWFSYSSLLVEPPSVWQDTSIQSALVHKTLKKYGIRKGLILDAGCGIGRMTIALAELGYDVIGVDISPNFVEKANERIMRAGVEDKAKCVVGDLRNLPEVVGGLRFDAILSWYSSFGFYGDEVDKSILRGFAWIAKKSSLLLIDIENRDSVLKARNYQEKYTWTIEHGDHVMIAESKYDPWTAMDSTVIHVYKRGLSGLERVVDLPLKFRLYSLHELAKLYKDSGWEPMEAYGDWNGSRFALTSPRLILVGKRY
ncbi:hypothetical protein EYM_00485 [Ignicoccus islandicus DSM 13165]|uniref:Methyltransferase domain-containing protein n=1 Tax=Ignicoccus islandicus DSM 13165 TaxID=940295 RepID=A0A0U3F3J9_9CREN|nr:class I SAM-dependent methyltransferase [Ignicoccus islandicus]ALU12117.1 hypothetical protein EYM_00485 [Ignicoccus islandicus DSM 13165]